MPKYEIGDRVLFRYGERENWICDACGFEWYDSGDEAFLINFSGLDYQICAFWPENTQMRCVYPCDNVVHYASENMYSLVLNTPIFAKNRWHNTFTAYESELSPINQSLNLTEGRIL